MTNNFQVVIGKGGFGVVYQGCLNNEQAAIKVLSHSSAQGYKEFKTEVFLLNLLLKFWKKRLMFEIRNQLVTLFSLCRP